MPASAAGSRYSPYGARAGLAGFPPLMSRTYCASRSGFAGPPLSKGPALHGVGVHRDSGVAQRQEYADHLILLKAGRYRVVVVHRKRQASQSLHDDRVEFAEGVFQSEPSPRMSGFIALTH